MLYALILMAQEEGAKPQPDGGFGGLLTGNPLIPMMLIMAAFFFLIILPSQRRQKQEREAISTGLKENDEVVTSAGIIGIVAYIKENADEVALKIDGNARIRVLKSSIVRILKKDEAKDSAASAAANTNIKPT
jgi:preprotein translocase subunit YajC